METEWRKIDGWVGYEVSRCGKIRSFRNKRRPAGFIMKLHLKKRGNRKDGQSTYWTVTLHSAELVQKKPVHRLVATAFHPNPENKPQVNHKDGDSLNNHADNLEWCTAQENTQHAWETGLCKRKWDLSNEQIQYLKDNYVKLGSVILSEQLQIPQQIVLKYANKHGISVKDSLFKKVIDTSNNTIYNSIHEVCKITGKSVKEMRRKLSNERRNLTPFRYIDNRGNITEAKYFEPAPRFRYKKPVGIFDNDWNLIEKFDYPEDLTIKYGVQLSVINNFVNGKTSIGKGYKFKLIGEDGNFIEPTPFVSKRVVKPKKEKQPVSPTKKVLQYQVSGEFIREFPSILQAALSIGSDKKQFRKQVLKSKTGYAKGYNWKVID